MSDAENWARHRAGLPHDPHPDPLIDDAASRDQTPEEQFWDLHDRGYIDDAEYAAQLAKLRRAAGT